MVNSEFPLSPSLYSISQENCGTSSENILVQAVYDTLPIWQTFTHGAKLKYFPALYVLWRGPFQNFLSSCCKALANGPYPWLHDQMLMPAIQSRKYHPQEKNIPFPFHNVLCYLEQQVLYAWLLFVDYSSVFNTTKHKIYLWIKNLLKKTAKLNQDGPPALHYSHIQRERERERGGAGRRGESIAQYR